MKSILAILTFILFSFTAKSQGVERITATDVAEANTHPRCSGANLVADRRPMPENSGEDIKIASFMRQFRAYRDQGQRTTIHNINDGQTKYELLIKEVTPGYFHIHSPSEKSGTSYCLLYNQITEVVYEANGNLHIYIKR